MYIRLSPWKCDNIPASGATPALSIHMKKTLITLAALAMASVASAADKPITLTIPTGGNFYAGSFEQDFKIDSGNFTETVLMAYWGSNSNHPEANAYFIKAENNLVTITVGRGSFASSSSSEGVIDSAWTWHSTDYKSGTFDFVKDDTLLTTYTLKVTGGDQSQQVSVLDCDGNTLLALEAYAGNMNGGDGNTVLIAQMNRQFAIPEPTTATLSLLALAGLAARRRRK